MHYLAWAVLGMVGYSTVTLMVKLAARTGDFNAFAVRAIATAMVATAAITNAWLSGAFAGKVRHRAQRVTFTDLRSGLREDVDLAAENV